MRFVIIGAGRVGLRTARVLSAEGHEVTLIERDAEMADRARDEGYNVVEGDGSRESILEEAGIQTIDFLSMDIEGAEIAALAGFSIERYKPSLACVEAKPENREKLAAYFAAHGYEQLQQYAKRDPVNNYYAPKAKAAAPR